MAPAFEVADVLNAHWLKVLHSGQYNTWQLRTLDAVRRCRTASLGSHIDGCTSCGHLRISYNSCRNRHCPKCQGREREKWIQAREAELLPVPYFHSLSRSTGWYLRCLMRLTNYACINQKYCMTCCSKQHGVSLIVLVTTISG